MSAWVFLACWRDQKRIRDSVLTALRKAGVRPGERLLIALARTRDISLVWPARSCEFSTCGLMATLAFLAWRVA